MDRVRAEVELVFNGTAPSDELPSPAAVVMAVVTAAEAGDGNFNLTFNTTSIKVTGKEAFGAQIYPISLKYQILAEHTHNDGNLASSVDTNIPGSTTRGPTTTVDALGPLPVVLVEVTLTNRTFVEPLRDPNSPEFTDLAKEVERTVGTLLNTLFKEKGLAHQVEVGCPRSICHCV